MTRYLVTYHGGAPPSSPEQAQEMASQFGAWLQRSGRAVVDPGAPVKSVAQIAKESPDPHGHLGGYSLIEADSVDEAKRILESHPFVARGGTLQVFEPFDID